MGTPAQILANRQNAKASTGPVTPQGKARSAANATTHGLSSAFSVLAHEDQNEFDEMYHSYFEEFSRSSPHETFLVQQMIQARWRTLRIQRLELRFFDLCAGGTSDDPDSRILAAMEAKGVNLAIALQRYAASAERSYRMAHRELVAARDFSTRQAAAGARIQNAANDTALFDYIFAPLPTLESEQPFTPQNARPYTAGQDPIPGSGGPTELLHGTRQSLRAAAL